MERNLVLKGRRIGLGESLNSIVVESPVFFYPVTLPKRLARFADLSNGPCKDRNYLDFSIQRFVYYNTLIHNHYGYEFEDIIVKLKKYDPMFGKDYRPAKGMQEIGGKDVYTNMMLDRIINEYCGCGISVKGHFDSEPAIVQVDYSITSNKKETMMATREEKIMIVHSRKFLPQEETLISQYMDKRTPEDIQKMLREECKTDRDVSSIKSKIYNLRKVKKEAGKAGIDVQENRKAFASSGGLINASSDLYDTIPAGDNGFVCIKKGTYKSLNISKTGIIIEFE